MCAIITHEFIITILHGRCLDEVDPGSKHADKLAQSAYVLVTKFYFLT
jgi:hypothetical protein